MFEINIKYLIRSLISLSQEGCNWWLMKHYSNLQNKRFTPVNVMLLRSGRPQYHKQNKVDSNTTWQQVLYGPMVNRINTVWCGNTKTTYLIVLVTNLMIFMYFIPEPHYTSDRSWVRAQSYHSTSQ